MTSAKVDGCSCPPTRRRWLDDGTCANCLRTVHEFQIMDVVKAVLVADPACLLWRNEVGMIRSDYYNDGTPRPRPVYLRYGLCNPGGADLMGCYGSRLLAVETKTVHGRQNPDQIKFERKTTARGNVYALVRSEAGACVLLEWLRAGVGSFPVGLRGQGHSEPNSVDGES
jgi:hypothetical protein